MNREILEARKFRLLKQHEELTTALLNNAGALREIDFWLAQVIAEESKGVNGAAKTAEVVAIDQAPSLN